MIAKAGFTHDNVNNKSVDWYTPKWLLEQIDLAAADIPGEYLLLNTGAYVFKVPKGPKYRLFDKDSLARFKAKVSAMAVRTTPIAGRAGPRNLSNAEVIDDALYDQEYINAISFSDLTGIPLGYGIDVIYSSINTSIVCCRDVFVGKHAERSLNKKGDEVIHWRWQAVDCATGVRLFSVSQKSKQAVVDRIATAKHIDSSIEQYEQHGQAYLKELWSNA